ncbi:MAG: DUF4157 domain-containing protein [Thermodesulfobacteriota bacterium]
MKTARQKTVNRAAGPQPAAAVRAATSGPAAAPLVMQALRVSSPKDAAEKEAEATAGTVLRMALPAAGETLSPSTGKGRGEEKQRWNLRSPLIHRFVFPVAPRGVKPGKEERKRADEPGSGTGETLRRKTKEEKEKPGEIQRKAGSGPDVAANVETDIRASMASGAPLPLSVRRFMEPRFGADFGRVRIHTSDRAAALNRRLNAQAFTVGSHIFFGENRYQPETDEGRHLIAHELTHTIQQGAAAQRRQPASAHATGGIMVQRLGLDDALDYFADHANHIPGFRMLTVVIGMNPITRQRVERSGANIMRAVVEFMPGGAMITRALDNHNIFERVAAWVGDRIRTLAITGQAIGNAILAFLRSLSWRDIFNLSGVWNRAIRLLSEPVQRIIAFVRTLVSAILRFIREAILRPLAALAETTRGYDLLKAVLGRDPVTGAPCPRTAETLIGGFMRLIGREEVWNNLRRANAVARAWAWFQGALAGLMGFVRQIPSLFLQALQSLTISDLILVPRAFARVAIVFGGFLGRFLSWAGGQVMALLQIIFEVVAPGVMPYLRRATGAFRAIIQNPVGFVRNLVRAGIQGFRQFAANFLDHLRTSLINWLTGTLSGAGVYIPQSFTLREIIRFVLSVLGLTWRNLRVKLVRAVGETAVRALERGFTLVRTLVTQGPAAAWEQIRQGISNLRELVMEQIMSFVAVRIVQAAITRLVTSLNPAGAFIQAILAIYNTIMFFVERLRQIAQVAMAFIDSIAAIAGGVIAAAADRVERTMAGLLTLVISFLARLVGLGRVSDAVTRIIARIRAPIDRALDRVVNWIRARARTFLSRLLGGDPNAPAAQRVRNGLREGVASVNRFAGRTVGQAVLRPLLAVIRSRHRLSRLEVVPSGRFWAVVAAASPPQQQVTDAGREDETAPDGSQAKPFPITWPKRPAARYPRLWLAPRAAISRPLPQSQVQHLPGAELFSPTLAKDLPGDGESIGIAEAYQTRVDLVVGPKRSGRSDSEKNRFNRLLAAHGYDRSEEPTDGDHVVEMQVSGPDAFANLWPLNSSENRSGGTRLNNTEVTQSDGSRRRVRDLAGKYFKITGFDS